MKHEHSVLLVAFLVAVVTVNLCHGFAIKEPGAYTASFSKSSSSASAFSHASSSSYTFGGNLNPTDLEALKAQAVAHASAEAVAGSGATAGAVAGATAHAAAGSTSSNAVTGSAVSNSGAVASSNAGNDADVGLSSSGAGTDSNTISVSGLDDGSYKKIASDKYTTNYSGGSQTNYAVSGEYVQPQSNSVVTGCTSCKGLFPGPNGSIHDYKPAGSVASSGSYATSSGSGVSGSSGTQYQPVPVVVPAGHSTQPQLPGSAGSIYSSKPASGQYENQYTSSGQSSSTSSGTTYTKPVSDHVLPSLIATLPGPSGSIFDSKPASAVAGASASAVAGASASSTTQEQHVIPVASSPCSSGSGCGSAYHATPGLANIIPVLPGPSGSIYDSKPVSGGVHSTAGAVSGSSSNVYNTGTTVHTVQPVVVPVAPAYSGAGSVTYNPHTTTQSGSKVVQNTFGSSDNSVTQSTSGAYSGAGSVTNIPASHPIVGPVCSYTPGSGKQCGSPVIQVSQTASESGSSSSNQYESGSVTSIPTSPPVVRPACSYASGSGQNCGAPVSEISQTQQESGASSSSQQETDSGSVIVTPSIHPGIPEAGTYYINKPSQNVEAPLPASPNFSGQIPCTDNSCGGETQKASSGAVASAGAYATAQNSGNSGIVYPSKDTTGQYSGINHDQAHLSGGVVFQNEDGSYYNHPAPAKPIYKNSASGGYAVSSNPEDNTGVLIGPGSLSKPIYKNSESGGYAVSTNSQENTGVLVGPGTGHLPIETDKTKELASSGATIEKSDKTTQGASSFSSASSQATEHTNTGTEVTIEKLKGTEITPEYPAKPNCLTGNCGLDANAGSGTPITIPCYGKFCSGGTTQVYVIEEKEPYPNQYGNGYLGQGYQYGGSGVNNGYATGQVLVNQGSHTYDVTNKDIKGSGYAGNYGGHYASIPLNPHSGYSYGCKSGKCGGLGPLPGLNIRNSALSGAYSSSGAFGGASAGSFASASAGATASAGSYAGSY